MAKSDPQSQRKRTWGEFLFGGEEGAAAKAQYKREMGINPANKRKQNVEAAISAKAMDNPTSVPPKKLNAEQRVTMDTMAAKKKGLGPNKFELAQKNPINKAYADKDLTLYLSDKLRNRKKSGVVIKPLSGEPPKSDFAKNQQGMKVKGSPTYAESANKKKAVSNASDKSRLAGKMTNFEKAKAARYEKEGYNGRSMTAAQAKARVAKERDYKFADLFKKKK